MDYTTVNNNLDSLDKSVDNLIAEKDKWKSKYGICNGLIEMYNPVISVPSFTFNGVTCKNVNFLFMGIAESKGNIGKAIYMSADCLPEVQVSMDSLLAGGNSVGTGTIGKAAATSLDSAIKSITGKNLQPYTRTYDNITVSEKVFLPLECEVHGELTYSADAATLSKYPQWEGFKKSPDSKIKYIDYSSNKYRTWYWWCANKSLFSGRFCAVDVVGDPYYNSSGNDGSGVALAFCL